MNTRRRPIKLGNCLTLQEQRTDGGDPGESWDAIREELVAGATDAQFDRCETADFAEARAVAQQLAKSNGVEFDAAVFFRVFGGKNRQKRSPLSAEEVAQVTVAILLYTEIAALCAEACPMGPEARYFPWENLDIAPSPSTIWGMVQGAWEFWQQILPALRQYGLYLQSLDIQRSSDYWWSFWIDELTEAQTEPKIRSFHDLTQQLRTMGQFEHAGETYVTRGEPLPLDNGMTYRHCHNVRQMGGLGMWCFAHDGKLEVVSADRSFEVITGQVCAQWKIPNPTLNRQD